MTKEQLEEIRKRKYAEDRIVYTVFDGDKEATALHIVYDNELLMAYMMLKKVYETKEQAEWYCKMTAEHTERFEPPMWENIPNFYGFYKFVFSYNNQYTTFNVNKECNYIEIATNLICTYNKPATKENYIEACEKIRDMFNKGDEK